MQPMGSWWDPDLWLIVKGKKNWENGEIEYELLLGANKDYCEFSFVTKLFFWLFILKHLGLTNYV